ncbi:MAG: hypothetical protein J6D18_03765, partial [Erysipelotrichaceae bacterium]|nr:hypothetical protein [Erysipelotrichaceae bacterium]
TLYLSDGLRQDGADHYRKQNFKDFELESSLGLSDEELNVIRDVKGVRNVEGVFSFTGKIAGENTVETTQVLSLTEKVSVPKIKEGKFPEKENECALVKDTQELTGAKIGDTVSVWLTNLGDRESPLKQKVFTVTGIVDHPDYIRKKNLQVVVLPADAFDAEKTDGRFTTAFIDAETDTQGNEIRDEYFQTVQPVEKRLWNLTDQMSSDVTEDVKAQAHARIDEQEAQANQKIAEGQQQLDANEAEMEATIAGYRNQLADGRAQLADAYNQLKNAETTVAQGEQQIQTAKSQKAQMDAIMSRAGLSAGTVIQEIDGGIPLLNNVKKAFDSKDEVAIEKSQKEARDYYNRTSVKKAIEAMGISGSFHVEGFHNKEEVDATIATLSQIRAKMVEYQNADAQIAQLEQQVADGKVQIEQGWATYNARTQEIDALEVQLNAREAEAREELAEKKDEFEKEKKRAEDKIKLAREKADAMKCNIVVSDRDTNLGYMDILGNADSIQNAGRAFGTLFILVSALVCFSTMTMIIEEEKIQVGTSKAFGFRKREIAQKYLIFGIGAAILGSLLGILIACILSEHVQNMLAAADMYTIGKAGTVIAPIPTVLISLGAVALCALASYIACGDLLRTPASVLMKGESLRTRSRKQKTKSTAGAQGTLYSRLIFRNMMTEKSRVLISILIIAGSVILVGIGITMKLSFDGMTSRQLSDVYLYDTKIELGQDKGAKQRLLIEKVLKDHGVKYTLATNETHLFKEGYQVDGINVISGKPNELPDYIALKSVGDKKDIPIPDSGILVQNRMEEVYGHHKGDTMELYDSSLQLHEAKVKNIFQNYLGRMIILSNDGYYKTFGKEPEPNCYYVIWNQADKKEVKERLKEVSTELDYEDSDAFVVSYQSLSMTFNFIIAIMVVMAIVMSFMILTNLANIYLSRKKRELTVMRINGF